MPRNFENMPHLEFTVPAGAFYFYIDIREIKDRFNNFCKYFTKQTWVALTPGIDFDKKNGHKTVRISFSSRKTILDGLK